MIAPSTARIASAAASAAPSARRDVLGEDDDVPAADALDDPEALLDEELALHHRDPPVAPAVEHLARLPAVAEEAQLAADVDLVLGARGR